MMVIIKMIMIANISPLLWAKPCSKDFTGMNSFSPHNNLMRWVLLLFSFMDVETEAQVG